MYKPVAGAVHDRNIAVILIFIAGIGIGIVAFVPMLRLLLAKAHDLTMAALTGLMAGSLRALWPWKSSYDYDPKAEPMHNIGIGDGIPVVVVAAIVGGGVVWLLAILERRVLALEEDEPNGTES
jgi:putative membrane protein